MYLYASSNDRWAISNSKNYKMDSTATYAYTPLKSDCSINRHFYIKVNGKWKWSTDFVVKPSEGENRVFLSMLIFRSGCQTLSLKVPGSDYNGTISVTVSGRTCQNWNSQTPHHHTITAPKKQYGNTNYCRNPNEGTNGVWCYTIDPSVRWEFCSQIQGLFRKFTTSD